MLSVVKSLQLVWAGSVLAHSQFCNVARDIGCMHDCMQESVCKGVNACSPVFSSSLS